MFILVLIVSVISMQLHGVAAGRMLLDEDDDKKPAKPVAPKTSKMMPQAQFNRMPASKPAAGQPAPAKPSVKDPGHSHGDGHDHDDD